MKPIFEFVFVAIVISMPGFIIGMISGILIALQDYPKQLHDVGIDHIAECRIDTPNCHSNWYEIVWIDESKNKK